MPALPPATPLRYTDSVERPEKDEAETTAALVETMRKIVETTYKDYGHAVRGAHAKSHGLLEGELHVLDGLPKALAQGLFGQPKRYPLVMRLSTAPGDILDDSVSTPRGMALKISGVDGQRVAEGGEDGTQDFVMVNGPAFLAPDAKSFLKSLKQLAATTDKAEGLKKAFSATLRGVEKAIEAVGGESTKIKSLGGHPLTHILGETFFTQVPLRYGDYIAKISVAPVSPELTALNGATLDLRSNPNGLRDAVTDFFRKQGGEWEVRAQLCTDLDTMPVEDASVAWPEDKSSYAAVARIRVPAQQAWSTGRSEEIDDCMSFSPWHALEAHRPLGSIMRARKPAYEMSAGFRTQHNSCPVHERKMPLAS